MRVESALELYKNIASFIPNSKNIAIGGYPALVHQGILKEERETGDLDIAHFNPKESYRHLPEALIDYISNDYFEFRGAVPDLASPFIDFRFETAASAYSEKMRKKLKLGKVDLSVMQQYEELIKMGVNRSSSLIIHKIPEDSRNPIGGLLNSVNAASTPYKFSSKSTNPYATFTGAGTGWWHGIDPFESYEMRTHTPITPSPKGDIVDDIQLSTWIKSLWQTIVNQNKPIGGKEDQLRMEQHNLETFHTMLVSKAQASRLTEVAERILREQIDTIKVSTACIKEEIAKIRAMNKEIIDQFFMRHASRKYFELSSLFVKNNMDKLKIDIFCLDTDKINKWSVVKDDVRYVHYYLILKAKYEYCKNIATDSESCEKHLRDLSNSYAAKKIAGINHPSDIKFLVDNRKE